MRIKGYQIGTLFNDLTIIIKIQRDSNIFQSWVVFLVIYISKTDQCHLDWNLFQLVSRTSLNRLHTLETSNVEADILASVQMCTDKMMNIFSSMVSASQINDKCSSLWLIANYLRMLSSNLKSCLMRYNKKYLVLNRTSLFMSQHRIFPEMHLKNSASENVLTAPSEPLESILCSHTTIVQCWSSPISMRVSTFIYFWMRC